MTIGILSDLHFGDGDCLLTENRKTGSDDNWVLAPTWGYLRNALLEHTSGKALDCLVLAGDTLDFSISSFQTALAAATPFFHALAEDPDIGGPLTERVIFIPGNHDKYVWDMVEWQTNVMMPLAEHNPAKGFRRTQPALLDLTTDKVELKDVGTRVLPVAGRKDAERWGGLFLEGLFPEGKPIETLVVYPNLYVRTSKEVWMVTHGHMADGAWVILGELLQGSIKNEAHSLKEMEEFNAPLTSLICTSLGQGGKVSDIFRDIQHEAKKGESDTLKAVLGEAKNGLDGLVHLGPFEFLDDIGLAALSPIACKIAEKQKGKEARDNKDFFYSERFKRFYRASAAEAAGAFDLDPPSTVIVGHTHRPTFLEDHQPLDKETGLGRLLNTGAWLKNTGQAVFFIDGESLSTVQL